MSGPVDAAPAESPELPPPLVKLTRHPLRWTANKLKLLVAALVLAHIGTLIVVGLYYLLFELYAPFTRAWHHAVTDNGTRHLLRNVYEGVLGGTLAQLVVFNHYARRRATLNGLDRLEVALHIPNVKDHRPTSAAQLAVSPVLVLIYAIPGFLLGYGLAWLIRHGIAGAHDYAVLVGGPRTGQSVWSHVHTLWTSNRDQKVVGLVASVFMGRRPIRAVAEDVQGYFAARRVALGRPARWYHPPPFQARMNAETREGAELRMGRMSALMPYMLSFALFAGALLAGFGMWVLAYKA